MAAATVAVRYNGAVFHVPRTATPGAALEALLGAACPLLLAVHAPTQDAPGAYALARLPGLAPLLPSDSKTRYLRFLDSGEALGAALARLHFPPAALYALPATAELLLLSLRSLARRLAQASAVSEAQEVLVGRA
jgi:hypothetical protein